MKNRIIIAVLAVSVLCAAIIGFGQETIGTPPPILPAATSCGIDIVPDAGLTAKINQLVFDGCTEINVRKFGIAGNWIVYGIQTY